jgi:flavorubredoxin
MYVGKTLRYENIFEEIRVLMDKEKIDYMTPIEIAEDIYWIGYADEGASLHCNPYIIIDGNEAVVIDGGSREEFSTVMLKILRLGVIPQNINALVYQHADPDLCASVPQFEAIIDKEDLAIISSRSEHIFLKYYLSYESSRSRILNIDEMGYEFSFSSGRKLKFIPIPYVHTPGSFMTYDTKTKTLFTSDLFGSFDTDWELFTRLPVECNECASDEECKNYKDKCVARGILNFHRIVMPSKRALMHALEKVKKLDVQLIAPQHGSIIDRERDRISIMSKLAAMEHVGFDSYIRSSENERISY